MSTLQLIQCKLGGRSRTLSILIQHLAPVMFPQTQALKVALPGDNVRVSPSTILCLLRTKDRKVLEKMMMARITAIVKLENRMRKNRSKGIESRTTLSLRRKTRHMKSLRARLQTSLSTAVMRRPTQMTTVHMTMAKAIMAMS